MSFTPKERVKIKKEFEEKSIKTDIFGKNQIKDVTSWLLKTSQWFRLFPEKDQVKDLALPLTTPERLKYTER